MLLGSHSQTVGKPVYFSFKWCHFWKEHLCWWAAKYVWVCSTNENSFSAKQLILLLTLDWSCLVDWMIEVWRNKTYWQFKDFVVSQRGCVGHSGPSWSHKCSMGSRSGLPAGHSILFTLSSVPDWSYGVATCCRISSRYLSALRWQDDDKSCFPVREMPPNTITLPPPRDATLLVQHSSLRISSTLWPYDPTAVDRIWTHRWP